MASKVKPQSAPELSCSVSSAGNFSVGIQLDLVCVQTQGSLTEIVKRHTCKNTHGWQHWTIMRHRFMYVGHYGNAKSTPGAVRLIWLLRHSLFQVVFPPNWYFHISLTLDGSWSPNVQTDVWISYSVERLFKSVTLSDSDVALLRISPCNLIYNLSWQLCCCCCCCCHTVGIMLWYDLPIFLSGLAGAHAQGYIVWGFSFLGWPFLLSSQSVGLYLGSVCLSLPLSCQGSWNFPLNMVWLASPWMSMEGVSFAARSDYRG